jgi:hypothetical protein
MPENAVTASSDRGTVCRVAIEPARFWTKVPAVEEGPLG